VGAIREENEERFWEKQTVEKVWLLYTLCKVETDIEKDPQSGNMEGNRQTDTAGEAWLQGNPLKVDT